MYVRQLSGIYIASCYTSSTVFSCITQSVMLFEEAPPLSPPTPLETPPPAAFSVAQLRSLLTQLSDIAPEGFMLAHTFVDTLYGFTDNTVSRIILRYNSSLLKPFVETIPAMLCVVWRVSAA